MISRILTAIFLIFIALTGFGGWRAYHYFFDTHAPTIAILGIEQNGYYAEEVPCTLKAEDAYKITDISVYLDGKPLINKYKVNSKTCSQQFTISTKSLSNGPHTLKAEVANGTYKGAVTSSDIPFIVDNLPLQIASIKSESDYRVFQGRTLHVQFQVNKEIKNAMLKVLSQEYPCFPESRNSLVYECFVPISCEETPNEYMMTAQVMDKVGTLANLDLKFQVIPFQFKKQNLQVDKEKVAAEKEAGLSAQKFEADIEKCTLESKQEKLWHGVFYPPIDIASITTEYGTIRTTQERGRYAHKAVDIINKPKSVVWATQDGIVVLKERYEHSGNTVVIDHGYGILSLFFHLDSFADISVGEKIKRGNPIGTLGKTGYASGYHLHWEMRINNTPVDPMQWIKPNFNIPVGPVPTGKITV
jgi:hypothetical protein